MTEKQVLLVKHSWSYVASQPDDLCKLLKKNLVFLCPELKAALKKVDHEKQTIGLMASLNHLVAALPDLEKVQKQFLLVLAEYSDLGISRDYYDNTVIAFLMSLEKKVGKNWNTEMRDSWIFIFVTIHQRLLRQLQLDAALKQGSIL